MTNSFGSLQKTVGKFIKERGWSDFHNPKDLSIAISTEAAELLELFRFKDAKKIKKDLSNKEFKEQVGEEIADILIFCTSLTNTLDMNIENLIIKKLEINAKKYPVGKIQEINKKWHDD